MEHEEKLRRIHSKKFKGKYNKDFKVRMPSLRRIREIENESKDGGYQKQMYSIMPIIREIELSSNTFRGALYWAFKITKKLKKEK